MKGLPLYLVLLSVGWMQARVTDADGDWSAVEVVLENTREAERIIRVGDIDNLGFGFPDDFNPFTGKSTDPHPFPFEASSTDPAPTDRILVGSGFTGEDFPEGQDGYTADFHPEERPLCNSPVVLPLAALRGVEIKDAVLCLMVDDFQAPQFKSAFQVTLNGERFPEMEKMMNALLQTGPIGKVIYVRLTQEMLEQLKGDSLSLLIDDPTTKAGDGFAIDFVKLMINPGEWLYLGAIQGVVVDDETHQPIPNAQVKVPGFAEARTNAEGRFVLNRVPAGLAFCEATALGYNAAQQPVDVIADEPGEPIELRLQRSSTAQFSGQTVRVGDALRLENIQFDVASAILRPAGRNELDRVAAFLREHPDAEIHLSGHTSSEGSAVGNRDLSFRRVLACKQYLVDLGLNPARITTTGHGPDQPIADNATEQGRQSNRRVELRFTKL